MYGIYPNLIKHIQASRVADARAFPGVYLIGTQVVASAEEMVRQMAMFLVSGCAQAIADRYNELPPGPDKTQATPAFTAMMNHLLEQDIKNPERHIVKPQSVSPSKQAVSEMSAIVNKHVRKFVRDQGSGLQEDFFSDVFDYLVRYASTGTMYSFAKKMDFVNEGKDYLYAYGAMASYLPRIASDVMKRRITRQTVHPVNEEGVSMLDQLPAGQEPQYLNVSDPEGRSIKEDFNDSLRETWSDVQRLMVRQIADLVDYMIVKAGDMFPQSPWAGWDKEAGKVTPAGETKAKQLWKSLFIDLFAFVRDGILNTEKPLSYAKLRGEILRHVQHKQLATYVKDQFESMVIETAKRTVKHSVQGPKLTRIMEFFNGVEGGYDTDLKLLRHQMASRHEEAAAFVKQMSAQATWYGEPRLASMAAGVVERVFTAAYCGELA